MNLTIKYNRVSKRNQQKIKWEDREQIDLDNVVREGLSEAILLRRILNKEKNQALQIFGEKHSEQNSQQVQRAWDGKSHLMCPRKRKEAYLTRMGGVVRSQIIKSL